MIALFERAVGLYASLININAYHQPGVEAGKKAATAVIALQQKVVEYLTAHPGSTLSQIAEGIGQPDVETIFKVCEHLAANPDRNVTKTPGLNPFDATYKIS